MEHSRNFNCKDEELLVVAGFIASGFRRDLADFSAFSAKFDASYAERFEAQIAEAFNLVEPQSETLAKSIITERYSSTILGLTDPVNRISGYLKLAKNQLKVSATTFGLTALRKSVWTNDVEGVIANLHVVLSNVEAHKAILADKGLADSLIDMLKNAANSLMEDKQEHFKITSNRKAAKQCRCAQQPLFYCQRNPLYW